jgi:hypothetical protein
MQSDSFSAAAGALLTHSWRRPGAAYGAIANMVLPDAGILAINQILLGVSAPQNVLRFTLCRNQQMPKIVSARFL